MLSSLCSNLCSHFEFTLGTKVIVPWPMIFAIWYHLKPGLPKPYVSPWPKYPSSTCALKILSALPITKARILCLDSL
jgi:hypothetical protein